MKSQQYNKLPVVRIWIFPKTRVLVEVLVINRPAELGLSIRQKINRLIRKALY